MHELIVLAGAENEILATYAHYMEVAEDQAAVFAARLDYCLDQLKIFPALGPHFEKPFRRLVLGKLPYSIFYSVSGNRVLVQAVLHLRTEPAAIRRRLRPS